VLLALHAVHGMQLAASLPTLKVPAAQLVQARSTVSEGVFDTY
jgi:hypothetical protein